MVDESPESDGPTAGMPRWVKVFAVVAAIFVVLLVVMPLTGHGPGRHLHSALGPVHPW